MRCGPLLSFSIVVVVVVVLLLLRSGKLKRTPPPPNHHHDNNTTHNWAATAGCCCCCVWWRGKILKFPPERFRKRKGLASAWTTWATQRRQKGQETGMLMKNKKKASKQSKTKPNQTTHTALDKGRWTFVHSFVRYMSRIRISKSVYVCVCKFMSVYLGVWFYCRCIQCVYVKIFDIYRIFTSTLYFSILSGCFHVFIILNNKNKNKKKKNIKTEIK